MTALEQDLRSIGDAVEVLPHDAPRDVWLAARAAGIGGSDASTVAGVNPWSSRYELWLDKTGRLPEREQTNAMRLGHALEPVLRQLFLEEEGIDVELVGLLRNTTRPWQQVSLDGLTSDGGVFEAKTTSWRMADEWDDDQVSDHAEIQVQHAMAVTGLPHAWVAFLVDGRDFGFRKVLRDDHLIAQITAMEDAFWHSHVLTDVQPALEPNALGAVKDRWQQLTPDQVLDVPGPQILPLLDELDVAKAACKIADANRDRIEAQVIDLIADLEAIAVGGVIVATRKANGTFAAKRFEQAHPDLAATYRKDIEVLDVERIKTEHPDLYSQHRARVLRPAKKRRTDHHG